MLILLHGEDTYRSRARLRELTGKFVRDVDPSGINLAVLDGASVTAAEIWGAIAAQSFLVRQRMVVIEELGTAKSDAVREEVAAFLSKIPEDVTVVFWESKSCKSTTASRKPKPKKQSAAKKQRQPKVPGADLFKALLTGESVEEFVPLVGAPLERWVEAYAVERHAAFAPGACRELCAAVRGDLWRMAQEIEKLTLAAAENSGSFLASAAGGVSGGAHSDAQGAPAPSDPAPTVVHITSALIREHVEGSVTDNIFAFVDALGRSDTRAATAELAKLLENGAAPEYLVTMIARQLRLLMMAADLLARGTPPAALAGELGCAPFAATKIAQQARTQSLAHLKTLSQKLLDLDLAIKSSRAPRPVLLELFCLEATAATVHQ
ncbi:MAG: hypothetical protein Q7T01_02475 [bacterium]|nr:hypothetical protein [bacterium]